MLAQPLGSGMAARKPWPTVVREAQGQGMAVGWQRRALARHTGSGRVLEFFENWLKLLIRISTDSDQLNQHRKRLPQFFASQECWRVASCGRRAGAQARCSLCPSSVGVARRGHVFRVCSVRSARSPQRSGAGPIGMQRQRIQHGQEDLSYAGLLWCALSGCSAVPVFTVPGM